MTTAETQIDAPDPGAYINKISVVITTPDNVEGGMSFRVYPELSDTIPEDDRLFLYALTRGMAIVACSDTQEIVDIGMQALREQLEAKPARVLN